jgi:chorismate mutase
VSTASTPDESAADLSDLRAKIERVDRALVSLLVERVELARQAGRMKRDAGISTLDPAREAAVLRRMTEVARDRGLHTEDARDVFWAIIGMCRRAQTEEP